MIVPLPIKTIASAAAALFVATGTYAARRAD
jgi:hypothetical protein